MMSTKEKIMTSAHKFFNEDELLDVVNEHDEVVGQEYRSKIYTTGTPNFRVINAFVMNDDNHIWIPRRSAHKKLYPLCLDASVGGHVQAGETYQQAFEREMEEELNIKAKDVVHSLITYLHPRRDNVSAHMNVYRIAYNKTPDYNTDDFVDSFWMSIPELQHHIMQGDRTKGDLPALIAILAKMYQ
jgi:isopentenyldiphosphate isomerase